jgi:DNA-binding response OmpR family regulator
MTEVVLVRWPEERSAAAQLVETGVAVLYLVDAEAKPPLPTSCLEDWVRAADDHRDLSARVAALQVRAGIHRMPPSVDEHGHIHYQGRVLPLTPAEARIAALLTERIGEEVTDEELRAGLAAGADPGSPRPLRTQMAHLRAQLREIGLDLHRTRGRGYKLQRR